jgi:hypothetical protein
LENFEGFASQVRVWLSPWTRKPIGVHDQLLQKATRKETLMIVEIEARDGQKRSSPPHGW